MVRRAAAGRQFLSDPSLRQGEFDPRTGSGMTPGIGARGSGRTRSVGVTAGTAERASSRPPGAWTLSDPSR